jgi:hypothetical protein
MISVAMTDQATEVEKAIAKGKKSRLPEITERQSGQGARDYMFAIVIVVGIIVVAVLAIAAAQYL